MKIQRIDHIVIPVEDMERSIRFYTHVLGMELEVHNHHHALKFGNQKINLHLGKAEFLPAAQNPSFGSTDICFVIEGEIASIKAELEQKGVPIEEGVVQRQGALGKMDSIYFRDPDGNLIELSSYG